MIDLHTHILCGVDDGARTPEESLRMLRMEREQGIDTVVLTPHFYRDRQRPESFFEKRDAAFRTLREYLDALPAEERETLPRLLLGAEVAWRPNMARWEDLERFCIEGTRNMLLELPFGKWDAGLSNQLYDLMNRTGITPILAHVERYIKNQKASQVEEILSLGLPVQISSTIFLRMATRGTGLKALKHGWAHVVASDCHDPEDRCPDMGRAIEIISKKLGGGMAARLDRFAESLVE